MIRNHEVRERDRLTYVRAYDSVHDLIDLAAERVSLGKDSLGNASLDSDHDFTGTRTLGEAVDLARYGWPEGTARISAVAEKIAFNTELLQSAVRVDYIYDVTGDEPDIDRYLQNDPENMFTYAMDPNTHGRILDFIVNVSQSAGVDKKRIENRGAAILAAVEALRARGYSIGVVAVEQTTPSSGYDNTDVALRYEIPILEPGQAVNIDTLAFSIMHASFLRRLIFAANEHETDTIRKQFGFVRHGGYGQPNSIKDYKHQRPAHIIDKSDGLHSSDEETLEYAQELVEQSLKTLSVDNL